MSKPTLRELVYSNASVVDILAAGYTADDLATAVKAKVEADNRHAQSALDYGTKQPPKDWAARKAWLLDGQNIHGELKEFFWPALDALKADDQAEFSRYRDLLFKAVYTFIGDRPVVAGA